MSLAAACGGAEGQGAEGQGAEASDEAAAASLSPLAEYESDGRRVAFYRAPDGSLLMQQDTPEGASPLISPKTVGAGRLPSEMLATVSHSAAPQALLDIERELNLKPSSLAAVRPPSTEGDVARSTSALTTDEWFSSTFCDSIAWWEVFRTTQTPFAEVKLQYYFSNLTANKQVTYSNMIFGHSVVLNKSASGVVVNKVLIDNGDYAQGGAIVEPNTVIQMVGWSNRTKTCGLFGWGCFYTWNARKFTLGALSVDSGKKVNICGFGAGE
jgi:hypothetical protein